MRGRETLHSFLMRRLIRLTFGYLGHKNSRGKPRGQSLVEFTIMLPVLLMLLSGVIEFGFLLNTYLDLIDAAREAARFAANDDPLVGSHTDFATPNFWNRAYSISRGSLAVASDDRIDWNPTDPSDCVGVGGDIIVSAFGVLGDTVDKRFPLSEGENGASNCGNFTSNITSAEVNAILSGSGVPNSGFALIEIYYQYYFILGLPWISAVVPEPITLHAYSIMPNAHVEPTRTP